MADDFIQNLKKTHPFPWGQEIHANGRVIVRDAAGKEVSLFAITDFLVFITNVMNKPMKEAA